MKWLKIGIVLECCVLICCICKLFLDQKGSVLTTFGVSSGQKTEEQEDAVKVDEIEIRW